MKQFSHLICLFVPINHWRQQKPELRFHNNVTKKALCPTANNDDADCRGCWTSPKWRSVELVRQHLFNQRRTIPTPAFWYLLQL